jgi:hypothetical protein
LRAPARYRRGDNVAQDAVIETLANSIKKGSVEDLVAE